MYTKDTTNSEYNVSTRNTKLMIVFVYKLLFLLLCENIVPYSNYVVFMTNLSNQIGIISLSHISNKYDSIHHNQSPHYKNSLRSTVSLSLP